MPNALKKLLAGTISALIGLVLIPILSIDFSFKWLPVMIIYFLPGFCSGLIILFELLIRVHFLGGIYRFVTGSKMIFVFFVLLFLQWIITTHVNPSNDIVFTTQFATGTIPAIWLFGYLGTRMKFLSKDEV
jgi:riboflavin transporter FmnP